MEYLTTLEMSEKWGISARRIALLCEQGRISGASTCISRIRSMHHTFLMRLSKQQPNTSIYILMQCPIAAYIPEISRIFLWRAAISVLPMWHWALSA